MKNLITTTILSIFSVAIIFLATSYNTEAASQTLNFSSDGKMYAPNCHCKADVGPYNLAPWCGAMSSCNGRSSAKSVNLTSGTYQIKVSLGGLTDHQKYEAITLYINGQAYSISDQGGNSSSTGTATVNLGTRNLGGTVTVQAVHKYESIFTGGWYSDEGTKLGSGSALESIDLVSVQFVDVTPLPLTNGQCNSSLNGKYLTSKPTSGLCTSGSASSVNGDGSTSNPWSWTCSGSNGGSNASCKAYKKTTPVNGECNSQYNGQTLNEIPPAGSLCTQGTESAITGDGLTSSPWTWTCDGADGGSNASCSATKEVQQNDPKIEIVKEALDGSDSQIINPGETAEFRIIVTNKGDVDLVNVAVTDMLAPSCDKTIGSLVAGFTHTYTCADSNVQDNYTNIAVVNGDDGNGRDVTDNDPSDVVVNSNPNSPSIQIVKDDNDNKDDIQTINPSETATFNIIVTNTGNVDLVNVTVTDKLSPNCDKTIGNLQAGFTHTYTCTIENVTDSFTNIAVVNGEDGNGTDVEDEDDSDVVVENNPSDASINIDKNDNGNRDDVQVVSVGGTATFSITVTNDGDVRLTDIMVEDVLAPNCVRSESEVDVLIEAKYGAGHNYLEPNELFSYTCTDTNIQDNYTNTAVVTGESTSGDVEDEDDSDVVAEDEPCNPEIRITKDDNDNKDDTQTVDQGETAEFTIFIENRGKYRLNDIVVTDTLASDCAKNTVEVAELIEDKYGAGHNYLDAWESLEYTCTDVNVQDSYTNTAIAEGVSIVGSVNDSDDSDVVVEEDLVPGIDIVKEALDETDIQTINPGETATFNIIVTNTGNVDLVNVTVTDKLSPNCDKTIGNLQAGFTHTYTCTIENVTDSFTNIAVVNGEDGNGTDVEDEDDSDVVVSDPANPSINIIKEALDGSDSQTIEQGETAEFRITVTNNGNVNLTNVVITDQLSPSCDKTFSELSVGESQTYTCSVDNVNSSFTNVVVVDTDENVEDEDDSDVVVEEPGTPGVNIVKEATDGTDSQIVIEGEKATFNIIVTNTGDIDLTNVIVTDILSPNCDRNIGNLTVGQSETYTCTIENVTESFTNTAVVTTDDVDDEDQSDVVVVEAPNPAITIVKDDDDTGNHDDTQTVNYGGTAIFNIYVKNTGNVRLTDISVSDNTVSNCSLTTSEAAEIINDKYGREYLESGESFHYECTDSNVTQGYTNTATAEGAGEGQAVNDVDTSDVIVECNCTDTDVDIIKESLNGTDSQTIDEGDDAQFRITVQNTGTARLNEFSVSDAKVSDCNVSTSEVADLINQKYGHTYLDAGESFSYECTDENVEESYVNVAIVTVSSDDGTDQDSDSTDINVDEDAVCNSSIGDFVWNDKDKDGVQDTDEEGISGVKLKLYNGNDKTKDYTNGQGFYEFDNLCEGEYDVVVAIETLPEGCYQTYDYDGSLDHSTTVNIGSGEDFERVDFGYYCPTTTATTTGTTSPNTGAGAVAGGAATLFASGAAWLAQRRATVKAASETLIKL